MFWIGGRHTHWPPRSVSYRLDEPDRAIPLARLSALWGSACWRLRLLSSRAGLFVGLIPCLPVDNITSNGTVNSVDIQNVINAALGIGIEYDVTGDGEVNAMDVQRVINAALEIF